MPFVTHVVTRKTPFCRQKRKNLVQQMFINLPQFFYANDWLICKNILQMFPGGTMHIYRSEGIVSYNILNFMFEKYMKPALNMLRKAIWAHFFFTTIEEQIRFSHMFEMIWMRCKENQKFLFIHLQSQC